MEIYILRDGKEIGPFSEEATQTLLKEGSVREADYAWHPGLPKWIPLNDVLHPPVRALDTPPPPPPPPMAKDTPMPALSPAGNLPRAGESATEKQKALLGYLGISFSSDLSKDQAALMINDAMEDAKHASRLAQWNADRLKLHPELFAAEINARKESRANDFFEICQTEGAEYFTKITKAHCQVLVGYLDVKFPNWDEDEKGAAQKYFFPAVAEKFPQLVAKQWKGKLRYATGPKIAGELGRKRPATGKLRRRKSSPTLMLVAVGRGLVVGVIILGMIYFVQKVRTAGDAKPAAAAEKPAANLAPAPIAPLPPPVGPDALLPIEPQKMIAQADPVNPAAPPALPPDPPPADPANPLMTKPAKPLAASNSDDAAIIADPLAPPKAAMAADPLAPKPSAPAALPGFPPDPPMANGAAAPDPLAPSTPAVAPVPAAPPPAFAPVDPGAVAKTSLKLTKPIEVQLAYGKMKLPVGTAVKLISRDGGIIKVSYLNTVLSVPITSTDFAADAPPPAVAPPASTQPAADL